MADVYLVGAGPGDPELLTVKAWRLLRHADIVVHDRLVSDEILALVPPGAHRVNVGKTPGRHHLTQEEINDLLAELALGREPIIRLKGGDPYVFGRGGEELASLVQRGFTVEVVPGITAAASTAQAGFPLTHRGLANSVTFVTGHCRESRPLDLDWKGLANPETTVVVYMGLGQLPEITAKLMAAGRSPDTPAALIENGTTKRQRQHLTSLSRLPRDARRLSFEPPTLIVVGSVVELANVAVDLFPAGLERAHG